MTMIKKMAIGLAAVSTVAMPIVASAAPAAELRAVSAVEQANNADGDNTSWPLILLGVAAAIGLIIIIADDDDPSSP